MSSQELINFELDKMMFDESDLFSLKEVNAWRVGPKAQSRRVVFEVKGHGLYAINEYKDYSDSVKYWWGEYLTPVKAIEIQKTIYEDIFDDRVITLESILNDEGES